MAESTSFEIRQIEPGDRLTGLSLGDAKFTPLKTFLEKKAKNFHLKNLAKTYAAFNEAKAVAYITLVCGEVAVSDSEYDILKDDEVAFNYKHYPAIKIARLAVDKRYRKIGLGESLVNLALGISQDQICPAVGCRFVIVDSKKESTSFYEARGFSFLDTEANRARDEPVMFVDLHKISN